MSVGADGPTLPVRREATLERRWGGRQKSDCGESSRRGRHECCCSPVVAGSNVGVQAEGDAGIGVTEPLGEDLVGDAGAQCCGRVRRRADLERRPVNARSRHRLGTRPHKGSGLRVEILPSTWPSPSDPGIQDSSRTPTPALQPASRTPASKHEAGHQVEAGRSTNPNDLPSLIRVMG